MAKNKEYFSARELAKIAKDKKVAGFPTTKRGVNIMIEREGWNDNPGANARPRAGHGGGMEYHATLLSKELRIAVGYYGDVPQKPAKPAPSFCISAIARAGTNLARNTP